MSAKVKTIPRPTTHPFMVQRRYGEPKYVTSALAARKVILDDLDDCLDAASRRAGSGGEGVRATIDSTRERVYRWWGDRPLSLDIEVDEHTGVRYQVEVVKR